MDRKTYQKAKYIERKSTHKKVAVTMTLSEFKSFSRLAKKEKMTPNRLILSYATAYRDGQQLVPKALKKRLDEHNFLIRNMANNLNQMAHSSNIFHDAEKQNILKNLEHLNKAVTDLVTDLTKP
ncbi:MAG: plasmid mobilization relaxosome protein MobC [Arenicella sp.]